MGTRHGEPKRDSNGPGTQPALPARATPNRMEKDTMISRTRLTRSSGPVTRLSACFAGMAALAAATLGFASAAVRPELHRSRSWRDPRPECTPGRGSSAISAATRRPPLVAWPAPASPSRCPKSRARQQTRTRLRKSGTASTRTRSRRTPWLSAVVFRAALSTNGSSVRWRAPSTSRVRRRVTSSSPRCSSPAPRPLLSSTT